jgi:plastocyanin
MRRFGIFVVGVAMAAVVAAGCGSDSGGAYVAPTGPAIKTFSISATSYSFSPKRLSAPAGILEFRLKSQDINHSLVIEGVPGFQIESGSGETASAKVALKAGKYTFYCDISGHRAQGMEGTLTVT